MNTTQSQETLLALADRIAARYGMLAQVEAVALGGSLATADTGPGSDIDLYVYLSANLSLAKRAEIAGELNATQAEVGNVFWEPGDEWLDAQTGAHIDIMFRTVKWIEEEIIQVMDRHEARIGYSTCILYNVRNSRPHFDRAGWYTALQMRARRPYPVQLQRAIIAKNHPILRHNHSSYRHQLDRAAWHGDLVSINHRVAALLASYFDILFAINRLPHPGEKRLIQYALAHCTKRPTHMDRDINALLYAAGAADAYLIAYIDTLVDGLNALLCTEDLAPEYIETEPKGKKS